MMKAEVYENKQTKKKTKPVYTDPNSTLVLKWYFPTFSHTQNQIYDILVKNLGAQRMLKE